MCSYPDSYITELKDRIKEHEVRIEYLEERLKGIIDMFTRCNEPYIPKSSFGIPTEWVPHSETVNKICTDIKNIAIGNIDEFSRPIEVIDLGGLDIDNEKVLNSMNDAMLKACQCLNSITNK